MKFMQKKEKKKERQTLKECLKISCLQHKSLSSFEWRFAECCPYTADDIAEKHDVDEYQDFSAIKE